MSDSDIEKNERKTANLMPTNTSFFVSPFDILPEWFEPAIPRQLVGRVTPKVIDCGRSAPVFL
jgi:hypothetical protein